jgi:predicted phosphate transport protein (TIGR00153 family)
MFGLVDKIWGPSPDMTIVGYLMEMAAVAHRASNALSQSKGTDLAGVQALESEGDVLEAKILVILAEAFQLRYFVKRDMEHLARELDSVIDGVQSVAKDIKVCGPLFKDGLPTECMQIVDIVCGMTKTITQLTAMIQTRHIEIAAVMDLVRSLDRAETAADIIRLAFREKIFAEYYPGGNAIAYQEITRLIAHLEEITDRANRVGTMIESIARK